MKMNKKLWLLCVCLALMIIGSSYPQMSAAQSLITADQPVMWETYVDNDYGFSLDYPSGWATQRGNAHAPSLPDDTFSLSSRSGSYDMTIIVLKNDAQLDSNEISQQAVLRYWGLLEPLVSPPDQTLRADAAQTRFAEPVFEGVAVHIISTVVTKGQWAYWLFTQIAVIPATGEPATSEDATRSVLYQKMVNRFQPLPQPPRKYSFATPELLGHYSTFLSRGIQSPNDTCPLFLWPTSGPIGYIYARPVSYGTHNGIDVWTNTSGTGNSGSQGNPVYAPRIGTVTAIYTDPRGANQGIRIEYGPVNGVSTWTHYWHMADETTGTSYIQPGILWQSVGVNSLLGYQGNRLWSAGDVVVHLHLTVANGPADSNAIDPSPYFGMSLNWNNSDHIGYLTDWVTLGDTVPPVIAFTQQPQTGMWYNTDQTVAWSINDSDTCTRGYKLAWDQNPPGGSEIAAASGSINLSSAGQGQHTLYIQAWDNAGNSSVVSAVGWLGYDTAAPTNPTSIIAGCTATTGVWQNSCADANFTLSGASDAGSGVAGYQFYWGTDANGTDTLWSTVAAYNPPAIGDGTYYFRVRTKDNAGNWSAWATVFVLRYDRIAPTGALQINANATTTYATLVKLQPSALDATSGVCQVRYRDAGGAWSVWQGYATSAYWQLPGPTGQSFIVETQFKDCAGNVSSTYSGVIALDIYPAQPASDHYRVVKSAIGLAGLTGNSAHYGINSTLGQSSMIGQMNSTNYGMISGYWAIQYVSYAVYLPLIMR